MQVKLYFYRYTCGHTLIALSDPDIDKLEVKTYDDVSVTILPSEVKCKWCIGLAKLQRASERLNKVTWGV